MTGQRVRALAASLVAVAALFVVTVVIAETALFGPGLGPAFVGLALAACLIAGLLVLWYSYGLVREHFRSLDRLRGAIVTMSWDRSAVLPLLRSEHADAELERLRGALAQLTARYADERAAPDQRLQAVLASITEAIVVITEQGQVSLVNYPAKSLLGAERVKVGTSVFAALERPPVVAAMERAAAAGEPVEAELETLDGRTLRGRLALLADHGGAVLSFAGERAGHRAELECDMDLHDVLPDPLPIGEDCPLAALPVLVLDTETTGLDVQNDRIVSIGAVRLHGARIYRSTSFDRLVNPGQAIPPRATAVHGITDAMVADAEPFAEVFADLTRLLDGAVLVGHNIAFDIAMLRRECEIAGLTWPEPPSLDTLTLVASFDPSGGELNLEALAERFGVDLLGRHTALGDCLVTAGIYARLLPQLAERGVTTLGQATAFAGQAKQVIKRQKAAGW